MVKVKKNDFIEITYTGSLEDGSVFDTTNESLAKEQGIHNHHAPYGAMVICLGKNQLIKGLDNKLEGKETDKDLEFSLSPDEAFGKKDAKMIQLISTSKFKKENITPMPGLQVNIDGVLGVIKTVSGGRTLVDFNHPLAGRELHYKVRINKVVTDVNEKVGSIIKIKLGLKDVDVKVVEKKATVTMEQKLPKELQVELTKDVKGAVSDINDVTFEEKKKEEKKKD